MKNWKTLRLVLGLAAALVLVYCGVNTALANDAQWAKNLLVYGACAEVGSSELPGSSSVPSSDSKPVYKATAEFDKAKMLASGTATLEEGTEPKRLFARITYFHADGTYTVSPVSVYEGYFEGMDSGNVIHLAVQIIDSNRIVPGTYVRYGGVEFDVE